MNESYLNDRVETDLSTIDNLLGVIRGFLTLRGRNQDVSTFL